MNCFLFCTNWLFFCVFFWENLLVHFKGNTYHSVNSFQSLIDKPRISIVLEQYKIPTKHYNKTITFEIPGKFTQLRTSLWKYVYYFLFIIVMLLCVRIIYVQILMRLSNRRDETKNSQKKKFKKNRKRKFAKK